MPEKKLKPVKGRFSPMQDGSDWPVGGKVVTMNLYYRRRLADGDLVEVGAAKSAPAPTQPDEPAASTAEEPARKGRKTGDA